MESYTHFAPLAERYDAFILDLWGVVHDGSALYPGVMDCLVQLREAKKRVVFLSNAPRRASLAIAVLERLGVDASLYDAVVTSGEAAYDWLKPAYKKDFSRYYFIGPERDAGLAAGLDYRRVDTLALADFLLVAGFEHDDHTLAEMQPVLQCAHEKKLPFLCLNPDMEVVKITGERLLCAGVMAEEYAKLGGRVHYFGKPHPTVYDYCYAAFGHGDRERILAVGDGIFTDIRGANAQGLDSVLIIGGILSGTLGGPDWEQSATSLCECHAIAPSYIMPAFRW